MEDHVIFAVLAAVVFLFWVSLASLCVVLYVAMTMSLISQQRRVYEVLVLATFRR